MNIALVPMSAKPYHSGHHHLIEYSSKNNDMVILYVSISDRIKKNEFPIFGKSMEKVWFKEIIPILPSNVEVVFGGSPVREVYEYIGEMCDIGDCDHVFTVYSDAEDTSSNYPEKSRETYMNPLYKNGKVVFAAESDPDLFTRGKGAPDCSGTEMREYLKNNDKEGFFKNLPDGVDKEWIFKFLKDF